MGLFVVTRVRLFAALTGRWRDTVRPSVNASHAVAWSRPGELQQGFWDFRGSDVGSLYRNRNRSADPSEMPVRR
jgi:hypothetical protein